MIKVNFALHVLVDDIAPVFGCGTEFLQYFSQPICSSDGTTKHLGMLSGSGIPYSKFHLKS